MAEYNLIQRPELIQRLQRRLGMRQAHITPTLSETLQPTIDIDHLVDTKDARREGFMLGLESNSPFAGEVISWSLVNPAGSGKIVRLRNYIIGCEPQVGLTIDVVLGNTTGSAPGAHEASFNSASGQSTLGDSQLFVKTKVRVDAGSSGIISANNLIAYEIAFANYPFRGEFDNLYITPGFRFILQSEASVGGYTTFYWEEEPLS